MGACRRAPRLGWPCPHGRRVRRGWAEGAAGEDKREADSYGECSRMVITRCSPEGAQSGRASFINCCGHQPVAGRRKTGMVLASFRPVSLRRIAAACWNRPNIIVGSTRLSRRHWRRFRNPAKVAEWTHRAGSRLWTREGHGGMLAAEGSGQREITRPGTFGRRVSCPDRSSCLRDRKLNCEETADRLEGSA